MEAAIKISSGATKWDIRQKVWDHIEENNLANFPRPVHNRIPNFKGAFSACARVTGLEAFTETAEVKVDPDKPLEGARLEVLQAKKTLLVPTPRLRAGLFNKITPPEGASKEQLRVCSTSQGVKEFSVPVGLDAKVKVDLVVVGSVAVSEKGYRIGKGEGYADMEYGMMVSMGAVTESTVVITIVHDCQVVDFSEELVEPHDLTVDYILTPTRIIKTDCLLPKPEGIIWAKLNKYMLEKIPVLKKLRALELAAGKEVVLGPEPPVEPGRGPRGGDPQGDGLKPRRNGRPRPRRNTQRDSDGEPRREGPGRDGPGGNDEAVPRPRRRPARVRREGGRGDNQANGSEEGREKVRGERRGRSWRGSAGEGGRERKGKEGEEGEEGMEGDHGPPSNVTTVYLGGIPAGLRVSELKTALREKEALPLRLTWQGAQHRAFLDYGDPNAADQAMEALQGLSLNGQSLHAELAKNQRGGRRAGPSRSRPRSRPDSGTKAEPNEDSGEPQKEEVVE
ncbi:methenyltetrahydrofolate synthase domain-containing protein isoform X1 [Gadus macrocephalus]|uniref:methenyltetrahydrofolate synthase domain-containing protein isoform X1 n=1 Tax=Gadus macrocephalus TaxID=80720 RepID=UPI0028CB4F51|nr:methenyltetrahydrofolate synthase domain-containing protein isoform X1 [Gadus macrocephalus]